jgi:hypothetical protein
MQKCAPITCHSWRAVDYDQFPIPDREWECSCSAKQREMSITIDPAKAATQTQLDIVWGIKTQAFYGARYARAGMSW